MTTKKNTGRWGLRRYAQILAAIYWKSRSANDVAEKLGCLGTNSAQSVREVLWGMRDLGLVHVRSWSPHPSPRSCVMTPVFAFGPGDDAPYPVPCNRVPGQPAGKWVRAELTHFATIVRELRTGATRTEICERCGTMHHNLAPLLREMRALSLARVCEWNFRESGAGQPAEVWKLGHGKEAQRPAPMSKEERQLRYRTRRRAKTATLRVVHAVAGDLTLPACGVQSWHLLGKASV
jgi:hypothetical protein